MRIRRFEFDQGWAECPESSRSTVMVGDRRVPRRIDVYWPGGFKGGIPQLHVTIDSSSGVPRCTDVRVQSVEGGREIRTTDLRAIEIDSVIEWIVPVFAGEILETRSDGSQVVRLTPVPDSEEWKRARRTVQEARRGARRKLTPDLLAKVAETYTNNPDRPAKKVEHEFGVAPRTAYRYISEARKQGLLAEKA